MPLPRLDLLIYAHDGRGLGHASRALAVAMACRRLFDDLSILFVSGTAMTARLIGAAPLDWLKLPAYATRVIQGASTGIKGPSGLEDADIGHLRAEALAQIIELYRPRCVLVDHMPQGKHKELLPALDLSTRFNTDWVLGVRGIVGEVGGVWSALARETFSRYYRALLWYGDSSVLGEAALKQLESQFSTTPVETGYVSRAAEIFRRQPAACSPRPPLAGVISIPWIGEKSEATLAQLADALARLDRRHGAWRIFIPHFPSIAKSGAVEKLQALDHCTISDPDKDYLEYLAACRTAVIYGGYNSLADILFTQTPALVFLRDMQDSEQQNHVRALAQSGAAHLVLREEDQARAGDLVRVLTRLLTAPAPKLTPPDLSGAQTAARYLQRLLVQQKPAAV